MVSKNLGEVVTNQYLGNHVELCLTDVRVVGSQSDMETHASKYGFLISSSKFDNKGMKRSDH